MSNFIRTVAIVALIISMYFFWELFTINKIIFVTSIITIVSIVGTLVYAQKDEVTSTYIAFSDRIEIIAVIVVTVLTLSVISAMSVVIL